LEHTRQEKEWRQLPNENRILRIDIDAPIDEWGWLEDYIKSADAVLKAFGYKLIGTVIRKSPSGRGLHIWLHIDKQMADIERVKMQFLLLDDPGRTRINRLRVLYRDNPNWNKLFTEAKALATLDEKCEKCKLKNTIRKIMEMEKECHTSQE